jgi:hypothetical protein
MDNFILEIFAADFVIKIRIFAADFVIKMQFKQTNVNTVIRIFAADFVIKIVHVNFQGCDSII